MLTQVPLVCVVSSSIQFLSAWLSMMMQPSNVPINPSTNTAWHEIPHKITVSFTVVLVLFISLQIVLLSTCLLF